MFHSRKKLSFKLDFVIEFATLLFLLFCQNKTTMIKFNPHSTVETIFLIFTHMGIIFVFWFQTLFANCHFTTNRLLVNSCTNFIVNWFLAWNTHFNWPLLSQTTKSMTWSASLVTLMRPETAVCYFTNVTKVVMTIENFYGRNGKIMTLMQCKIQIFTKLAFFVEIDWFFIHLSHIHVSYFPSNFLHIVCSSENHRS